MTALELRNQAANDMTLGMAATEEASKALKAGDETRYNEKREEAKKYLDSYKKLLEDADVREKFEKEQERAEVREQSAKDNQPGFNGEDVTSEQLNREITVQDYATRSALLEREYTGEKLSDQEREIALREFPAERLYFREVARKHPHTASILEERNLYNSEEREAWRKHENLVKEARAITPTMQAGTANLGGTLVPETLVRRIYARMAYYGPMVDSALVTRHTNNTTGAFKLPTITDNLSKKARIVGEGADATRDTIATGVRQIVPYKYTFQIPVTWELLLAGNVSFESWLMGEVGDFFGRALNEHFTTGDGSSKPFGLLSIAQTTGTNTVEVSKTTITDQAFEAKAYEAYGLMDPAHVSLPSTRWQMNSATVAELLAAREDGNKIWNVSQDGRTILFAGGIPVVFNNDIAKRGDGTTQTIAALGPLSEYHTLSVGGMRSDVDRIQLSDQYGLAWFDMWGGIPFWNVPADRSFVFLKEQA